MSGVENEVFGQGIGQTLDYALYILRRNVGLTGQQGSGYKETHRQTDRQTDCASGRRGSALTSV